MLRVVIDTSSLVSYVLTRGDLMRRVMALWKDERFVVLSSPATRAELAAVISRPAITRLSAAPLDELVAGIERFTLHVPGRFQLSGVCRDPKDDKFLACALEGGAEYIVSSDRDLLTLKRYASTTLLNPGQFLLALELYALDAAEMAAQFDRARLVAIQAAIPLEPGTAGRLANALELRP
jgi:uncharacterized protein